MSDIIAYQLPNSQRRSFEHNSVTTQYLLNCLLSHVVVTTINNKIISTVPIYCRGEKIQISLENIIISNADTHDVFNFQKNT